MFNARHLAGWSACGHLRLVTPAAQHSRRSTTLSRRISGALPAALPVALALPAPLHAVAELVGAQCHVPGYCAPSDISLMLKSSLKPAPPLTTPPHPPPSHPPPPLANPSPMLTPLYNLSEVPPSLPSSQLSLPSQPLSPGRPDIPAAGSGTPEPSNLATPSGAQLAGPWPTSTAPGPPGDPPGVQPLSAGLVGQGSQLDQALGGVGHLPGLSALDILISEQAAQQLPPLPTSFPALPALQLPKYQQVKLSNGLRVYLVEDHTVPLLRGSLLIRAGQWASPPDKVGLASAALNVQRAGGSLQHPAPGLDDTLEVLAAGVEAGAGPQSLTLDFFCSSEDVQTVVQLFAEVLMSPAMPDDRLQLYKDQVANLLEHQNDRPQGIARRELQKLMYGKDSVYARQPTMAGIQSITRQDLLNFIADWERPDSAVLGVVGDFSPLDMVSLLERQLGAWHPAPGQPPTPRKVQQSAEPLAPAAKHAGLLYVVDRPGLAQASVVVAEPGVRLEEPDSYPLEVLSTAFNSFGGQLFDQSREGLAYSVSGGWDSPPSRPGLFVAEFLTSLRRVLGQARDTLPTPELLAAAKDQTLNAFVFNFASVSAQLQRTLVYDLLELPSDLLFRYKAGIEAVEAEDVLRAARAHLHPEQQVTVVVADAQKVQPQLRAAGLEPMTLELDPL
ncbi:Metalloenzyme, LuxS/M16 peptidase-like protein [Haematococcus lacustris]